MKLSLEQLFSSSGRVKVLRIMLEAEELNISELVRQAGLTYTATLRHLSFLEQSGLLAQKRFGRIRIYSLKQPNPLVTLLRKFVRDWESVATEAVGHGY